MVLGGRIEVLLGPVPFILTDFFVFLAALLLRTKYYVFLITAFLTLGASGLPVFAGGSSGFEHLTGSTSGYLIGYLIGGLFVSIFKTKRRDFLPNLLITFDGYYILFVLGLVGMSLTTNMSFDEVYKDGFEPFILSMHLKASVATSIYFFTKNARLNHNSGG